MKLAKVLYLVGGILLSLLGLVMVAIEFRTLAAGDWLLDNNQFFAFFALLGKVLLFGLSLATGVLAIISAFTEEKRAVLLALFATFGGIGIACGMGTFLWVIPLVFVIGNILVLIGANIYFKKA